MEIEERWVKLFPPRHRLAARYQYRRFRGRLEPEMAWIDKLIPSGGRAIDVGANAGIYAYVLAQKCNWVEAFEPLPECAATIRGYGHPRITVHECGLSDRAGNSTLHIPISNKRVEDGYATLQRTDTPHKSIEITLSRLDDFDFKNVTFIKIDVEGHEQSVLRGGQMTISRERPVMLIEIEQRHHTNSINDVFTECLQMGYSGHFIANGKLQPISVFNSLVRQSAAQSTNKDSMYINNFIFKPI